MRYDLYIYMSLGAKGLRSILILSSNLSVSCLFSLDFSIKPGYAVHPHTRQMPRVFCSLRLGDNDSVW